MRAGDYRFAVGTAGSTGLVLQTVLMPLVLADGSSRLVLEGGTHNMAARTLLPWPDDAFAVHELPEEAGPGNALLLEARFEQVTEIMTGFGRLGMRAEAVARQAARRLAGYLASPAFAGAHLADQLLLPFALAGGGAYTTVRPSDHTRTAADIIAAFTDRRVAFAQREDGTHLVEVA